ncbi:cytochrome P450 [Streptomyces sp. NPDC053431]|uniref:cytochrome P450 n=1 Tax=Streptomyces sp. NPDC053431 TaxID=3365703 RepID=UPI0037D5D4A0
MSVVDPPDHTRLRKYANKGFTSRALQVFRPQIYRLIQSFVDDLTVEDKCEIDIVADFAKRVPLLAVMTVIGADLAHEPRYRLWIEHLLAIMIGYRTLDDRTLIEYARQQQDFIAAIQQLIHARRAEPREDLITFISSGVVDGGLLSDNEAISVIILLIGAGWETTAKAIPNILHQLLRDPSHWENLVEGRVEAAAVVEEGLRHSPSAAGSYRVTRCDVNVGGVQIPAGSLVFLSLMSAGRDETKYSQADMFDPYRQAKTPLLTFGHGIHYCLGSQLARMEMEAAFECLSKVFPRLSLAPGWEPKYEPSPQFRGLTDLWVKLNS